MWVANGGSHLYDCGILFAALDELIVCELGILVAIHIVEDFIYPLLPEMALLLWRSLGGCNKGHSYLLRRVLVHRKFDHRSCHLVDRLYDLKHLFMCDGAVSVNIVQLERP